MDTLATLLVYALITSAMFYLGSRALITRWLWSRYPKWLAGWADCSACSSFWYGIAVRATLGPIGGRTIFTESVWLDAPIVGSCMMVLTPVVAGLMQAGFERLGTVVDDG